MVTSKNALRGIFRGALILSPMATQDILDTALQWLAEGRKVALATVVETWGSAPVPGGSQLLVDEQTHFIGSVSGGCVETAVIGAAQEVISTGAPRLLEYGVTNEMAWEVGLACGGRIRIYLEFVGEACHTLLEQLHACRAAGASCVTFRNLDTHDSFVLEPGLHVDEQHAELHELALQALQTDRCVRHQVQGQDWFIQPVNTPLRLIIIGAVHTAQHLAGYALSCGYEVVVVDPRPAFASAARFPGVALNTEWPDYALELLAPDQRTALVTLSHDPKLDDPALQAALRSPAFYIGALGSSKTHAARRQRLRAAGLEEAEIAPLKAPVGLDIGARSPAEIAVSIMAQITRTLRKELCAEGNNLR